MSDPQDGVLADEPKTPFRLVLIGAGRVGTAVTELLRRRGHSITGVASRTQDSAQRAAQLLRTTTFDLDGAMPEADVVLVAVSDDALPKVIDRIAPSARSGMVFWHVSGSLALETLRPVIERGAQGCAVHPMQACPSVDAAIANLPGSTWGVTVTPGLDSWAPRLVSEDLQGVPVVISPEHRALWHAASITTSTGINAVLAVGEALLEEIGVQRPHEALGPLALGTLKHSLSHGARQSVTGPLVRGEDATLRRHLRALEDASDGSLRQDYLLVARLVLERAGLAGRINDALSLQMRALLDDPDRQA